MSETKRLIESIQKNLDEVSYSRIYQHTQDDSTFAIIGSEDQTTGESRYTELVDQVRKLTYSKGSRVGFNKVDGTYTYETEDGQETKVAHEKSLIIYNITREEALNIGNNINQQSIVWKDPDFFGIIYCSNGETMVEFKNEPGENMSFSNAEKEGFGTKTKKDKKNPYGFTFEGVIHYPNRFKERISESFRFKGNIFKDRMTESVIEGYTDNELYTIIENYINDKLAENDITDLDIIGIKLVGSRTKGTAKEDSDLDVLIEYGNDEYREDDIFNILNDEEDRLYIGDIEVDINPINKNRSGYTIQSWLNKNYNYNKEVK